jgi:hypothetical protein
VVFAASERTRFPWCRVVKALLAWLLATVVASLVTITLTDKRNCEWLFILTKKVQMVEETNWVIFTLLVLSISQSAVCVLGLYKSNAAPISREVIGFSLRI